MHISSYKYAFIFHLKKIKKNKIFFKKVLTFPLDGAILIIEINKKEKYRLSWIS